jgi:hypothetical protein
LPRSRSVSSGDDAAHLVGALANSVCKRARRLVAGRGLDPIAYVAWSIWLIVIGVARHGGGLRSPAGLTIGQRPGWPAIMAPPLVHALT